MMSMGADHRWSRSKYPLQASQPVVASPPSPELTSDDIHQWSFARLQQSPPSVERNDAHSPAGSNQYEDDGHADDESRTAVARSSSSQSHQSIANDHRSEPGEAEYHMLTTTASDPAEGEQESASSVSALARNGPGRRTLRRTSRSRRISSRISLIDPVEQPPSPSPSSSSSSSPSPSPRPLRTEPASPPAARTSCRRQQYPLQNTSHGSVPPAHPVLSTREELAMEANTASCPHKTYTQPSQSASPERTHAHRTDGMPGALPASPPTSESENEPARDSPASHHTTSDSAVKQSQPSRRRKYPLQAPLSISDLHRPLTPPSSESQPQQTHRVPAPSLNSTSETSPPMRRRAYPLQAPASVLDLKQPSVPKPATENQHGQQFPSSNSQAQSTVGPTRQPPRRQRYPLQSPASVANLRANDETATRHDHGESESQAHDGSNDHEESLDQVPERIETAPRRKAFRRQAYPLQSPASVADLKQESTASEPKAVQHEQQISVQHCNPAQGKSFKRQKYPLQSSASVADLQHASQSSPPASKKEENSLEQRSSTHSVQGPTVADEKHNNASDIFLPKNVRAVTDTERPVERGRTIVVCLDGTGDKFDDDNSNIVQFVSALKKDDPQQITYYQAGIGTYSKGGLSSGFEAAMDMAVGSGLGLHVRDAYHFLMHTYKEGDRICIFGFSRGAYTARCLAGMVHKVGLLPARNIQQIEFAYEFYKSDTQEGWKRSEDFKRTFSIDVNVYFVGCFDSVASVGFIPRQLPLSSTPVNKARYFRHAMALDERRAKFKICRYQAAKIVEDSDTAGTKLLNALPNKKDLNDQPPAYSPSKPYGKQNHPNMTDEEYERLYRREDFETDTLEVWFAGCHADIGGGAVANTERHKLAQIPLRWMLRQAFECNTGIMFKTKVLAEYGLDVHTLWPKYHALPVPTHEPPSDYLAKYETHLPPRSIRRAKLVPADKHDAKEDFYRLNSHTDEDWTPEQVEDYYDAMCPLNDQLVQAPIWWILEMWPVQYKVSPEPGQIVNVTGMNLGRYRMVEDYEAKLHWTVLHRAKQLGYKVHARPAAHTQWRVVA